MGSELQCNIVPSSYPMMLCTLDVWKLLPSWSTKHFYWLNCIVHIALQAKSWLRNCTIFMKETTRKPSTMWSKYMCLCFVPTIKVGLHPTTNDVLDAQCSKKPRGIASSGLQSIAQRSCPRERTLGDSQSNHLHVITLQNNNHMALFPSAGWKQLKSGPSKPLISIA